MNVTSKHVREKLTAFDGGFWGHKVSKNALLRDTGYWIPGMKDLAKKARMARIMMADALGVSVDFLQHLHTGNNGRLDCDDYARFGCAYVRAIHDRECRENDGMEKMAYAIWPFARSDIDHTQAICLTSSGWAVVEFINGDIFRGEDLDFKILLVG